MQRSFALTDKLLAQHRAGSPLCLAPFARGSSFTFRAERPTSARKVFAQATQPAAPVDGSSAPSSVEEGGKCVAVIEVRGLLSSEVSFWDCGFSDGYHGEGGIVQQVAEAKRDNSVCAVVIDAMSPGGDSRGAGEAAMQLSGMRGGKPTLVYAREANSAMYWLACAAADEGGLFVSESSDVGNIGTWTAHVDQSAANERDGFKVTYIADPPEKVLGNPDEPLAEEALSRLERDVKEITARFAACVAAHRPGLSEEAIRALKADTRRGAAAVAEGLADGLAGSLEEVVALAFARAEAGQYRPAEDEEEENSMPMSKQVIEALGLAAGASDAAVEAALLPRLGFAAHALSLLGESDPVKAKGILSAKLEQAEKVPGLEAQVAEKSASSDADRRVRLVEQAVVAGRLTPGQAWVWSEDSKGARVRSLSPLMQKASAAHAEVEAFEAYLSSLPVLRGNSSKEQQADTESADAIALGRSLLSPEMKSLAEKTGLDPAALAANTRMLFGPQPQE